MSTTTWQLIALYLVTLFIGWWVMRQAMIKLLTHPHTTLTRVLVIGVSAAVSYVLWFTFAWVAIPELSPWYDEQFLDTEKALWIALYGVTHSASPALVETFIRKMVMEFRDPHLPF